MEAPPDVEPAPSRHPGGRPPLIPEKVGLILELVRAGNHYAAAWRAAGIGESTFYNWKARGVAELERLDADPDARPDPAETPYREFVEGLVRVEHEAEARLVALWTGAAQEDWRAARDFLARRFPDRWMDRSKLELAGTPGQPVQVQHAGQVEMLTEPEVTTRLQAVMAALADAGALPPVEVGVGEADGSDDDPGAPAGES